MKRSNRALIIIGLLLSIQAYSQDNNTLSHLKNFEGIWQFIPPEGSNDTTFFSYRLIVKNKFWRCTFWKDSREYYITGPKIIGFEPQDSNVSRLSDLREEGQRLLFYDPNRVAPNDSIKYFEQASPSCFASFNGLGTDDHELPDKGTRDYILFNFNGRDYEYFQQISHLPNFVLRSLMQSASDLKAVSDFLGIKPKFIASQKAFLYEDPAKSPRIYLIKGDPVEVIDERKHWIKIRYYQEGKDLLPRKIIEGWVKKSDVE